MTTQKTLSAFIAEHEITIECHRAQSNPHMPDKPDHVMDHWEVILKTPLDRMIVSFSMGLGLRKNGRPVPPDVETVLDTLAGDAAGIENTPSFEDWCAEYGYDTDSRSAERTFNACEKQAEELKQFINDPDAFQELLYGTERL